MAAEKTMRALGRYVYGWGVMAVALVCIASGDFEPSQPVPEHFPGRTAWVYIAAMFMLVCGVAIQWRRTASKAAMTLAIYYVFVVVILMNGYAAMGHFGEFGAYNGAVAELALAAAAVIICALTAPIDAAPIDRARTNRWVRVAQITFGLCAVFFGLAHFVFMNLTAPLVPKWLPPSQVFWGYATGVAHIAGGIAIVTRIKAYLAAVLLTIMYASFTFLVHIPLLLANPSSHWILTENVLNIALIGAAWVVADSFKRASFD